MPRSLEEFAESEPKGGRREGACCAIPAELMAQIRKDQEVVGRTYAFYARWLGSEGHPIPSMSLRHHLISGHTDG
jgi:hypothetical protein